MTIVGIRQPGYMAHTGFFKRIQSCDIFVYLDDVLYEKRRWDNRNYINSSTGKVLLTVPALHKSDQNFNEVKIANDENWGIKHLKAIERSYRRAPYFDKYWSHIEAILSKKWEKLIDLNFAIIEFCNKGLEITTKTIKSSELNVNLKSTERLVEICKKLNADTYFSGASGKNYMDEELFQKENIDVIHENFISEKYKQLHGEFVPNLACIDLLFNEGENAKNILLKSKNTEEIKIS